ncbi:MAG TPA: alpha/beta fold hydrolase [Planctomycetota bacterium]|nr:alpha/beta fold hydrolase [Planctomycetota bacterium]
MKGPGELRNAHGERLDTAFHAGAPGRRELVVIAHGVTSSKDRPWLVELARGLEREGVAALRLSFAGNGDSQGRFEDATPSKSVDDLRSVLAALDGWTVAYAGHSMGAAVGVLCAARDARLRALVSLAGMLHVGRFFATHFARLDFGAPMLGKRHCPWNRALANDAQRLGSLVGDARAVRVPWLLVHGTADELVPYADALDARAAAGATARVELLEGVDHRFTGAIDDLVALTVPWLARTLRGEDAA